MPCRFSRGGACASVAQPGVPACRWNGTLHPWLLPDAPAFTRGSRVPLGRHASPLAITGRPVGAAKTDAPMKEDGVLVFVAPTGRPVIARGGLAQRAQTPGRGFPLKTD